nr:hypothetical protein DA06_04135 [Georgenia sp. SUBG003]
MEDPTITQFPSARLDLLSDDEGELKAPGTVVTVQVGDQTEPRNLSRTFPNVEYARTVLETQTAIGVYPKNGRIEEGQFHSQLDYREKDGTLRSKVLSSTYRFHTFT